MIDSLIHVNRRIAFLAALALLPVQAKPLKVFILAGQSNMQGHAMIQTFDYIGDDPATAPLLGEMRGAEITEQTGKLTAGFGASPEKDGPNADGGMSKEQQDAFLKDYRAKLIPPEDEAIWKSGASNAGCHYLGCAETFALVGKALAESTHKMLSGELAR